MLTQRMETADESPEPEGDGVGSLSNFYKLETWDDAKYFFRAVSGEFPPWWIARMLLNMTFWDLANTQHRSKLLRYG